MIDTRMKNYVKGTNKFVFGIVMLKLIQLGLNIMILSQLSGNIAKLIFNVDNNSNINTLIFSFIIYSVLYLICSIIIAKLATSLGINVKTTIRKLLYDKLVSNYRLVTNNHERNKILQLATEGISQLELYFVNYLPQFFYALIAPIILFIVVGKFNFTVGLVLFISVWLIPIIIALTQTIAKRVLAKHWVNYLNLGHDFLENLNGLLTLKLFNADKRYQQKMDIEAQNFRKSTMRVLTMQLNSITIMDLITYVGTAVGLGVSFNAYIHDQINITNMIFVILISFEFFLPMRLLGSFFHVAMNGISASKNVDNILSTSSLKPGRELSNINNIKFDNASLGYGNSVVVNNLNLDLKPGLTSIVGKSGTGKTTIYRSLLSHCLIKSGNILINNQDITDFNENDITKHCYIMGSNNFLFGISLRDNLLLAKPDASDSELIEVLKQVDMFDYFNNHQLLDTMIEENGNNLSGGQRQRICLAQVLLSDKDVYIFDEATSSVDQESEDILINLIKEISKTKIVILISHRLSNTLLSDEIIMIDDNEVVIRGTYQELVDSDNMFSKILSEQLYYEQYEGAK